MTKKVSFFLVVFDKPERKLVSITPFGKEQEALAELWVAEDKYLGQSPNRYEVVLLGAESLADLHKTHSRYFADGARESQHLIAL